jgi:hypothetical protein
LIYHEPTRSNQLVAGLAPGNSNLFDQPSAISLTYSQKAKGGAYKKRSTEITMQAYETEKTWKKVQLLQPVLATKQTNCSYIEKPSQTEQTEAGNISHERCNSRILVDNDVMNRTLQLIRTSCVPTLKHSRMPSSALAEKPRD